MNDQSSTHSFKALTQYFQRVEAVDVPHTGKSYLAHGIGVYRDLKAWGWAETAAVSYTHLTLPTILLV